MTTVSLARWISDADAARHYDYFSIAQAPITLAPIRMRLADYYISLAGDLFDRMRAAGTTKAVASSQEWARLGNALSQLAGQEEKLAQAGVSVGEATLFAAAAFYCGGFPASACLTMRSGISASRDPLYHACFELLARPITITSPLGTQLLNGLLGGDMTALAELGATTKQAAAKALGRGPDEWIPARILDQLVERFLVTNIRTVLPAGDTAFWSPLVASLLSRQPPSWDFFPSQIEAIQRGLLERTETFSLQMPTGAGKTTLCETLLYWAAKSASGKVSVLLVPYRSLASELRSTLVKRLNEMGIAAGCAYGGTVPTGDEVSALEDLRVLVATPEALSGLLGADSDFFRRISLVICDEGHLLDSEGRGVGLELLLARLRSREGGSPRFVFVSAIVPNIEEINAWLGGVSDSVVRSLYRPAIAEFAVLRTAGKGPSSRVVLEMHAHEAVPTRYSIDQFLRRQEFQYTNPSTGRQNTHPFVSVKTQAIAAARKALPMGTTAVFAANKRGNGGAVGLAEELLEQLPLMLPLPSPGAFREEATLQPAVDYLAHEYGIDWVGARALAAGAVLHHGDIPQETREVVERLVRQEQVRMVICTSTLAEGVNLPIRTLVLYSVQRRDATGGTVDLLTRDIKNLVGRAGRPGATTKGLVICANPKQWPAVERVAKQNPGEPVYGALRALLGQLQFTLSINKVRLTNEFMESRLELHTMVDGVDATLIDLAAEELGQEEFTKIAYGLADQTFASLGAGPASQNLLRGVFEMRSRRIWAIGAAGRLGWFRETGARARLLDAVEQGLLPMRDSWDDLDDPVAPELVELLLDWAWKQPELQQSVREGFRLKSAAIDVSSVRKRFFDLVKTWLAGARFREIAAAAALPVDDLLGLYSKALAFTLQTLIEQAVALLGKLLESAGRSLAAAVVQFPEHLRFGVPTAPARLLAAGGVRHRQAAVALGADLLANGFIGNDRQTTYIVAQDSLVESRDPLMARLGALVFANTSEDLASMVGASGRPEVLV